MSFISKIVLGGIDNKLTMSWYEWLRNCLNVSSVAQPKVREVIENCLGIETSEGKYQNTLS